MRPKDTSFTETHGDLFRSRLEQILDRKHPLYVLAEKIDWQRFDQSFGALFAQKHGRPALPTRLVVGLHYLKHAYNESDESVVVRFLENPYWQYFCGFKYFQHELPIDPSSMTRWRKRLGPEKIEELLTATVNAAKEEKLLTEKHVERVNVDTTVQEKAISFPTDARLYHKARRALVRIARKMNIVLRRSYERTGKKVFLKQGRYASAGQHKRANKETEVHLFGKKKKSMKASLWKWFSRRSAIEPIFGHLKSDHRLERNHLQGKDGDRINAILSGCGFNLRKILRAFFLPIAS